MMYPFDTPKEKRVVIYARVSTEHEAQVYALGNQLESIGANAFNGCARITTAKIPDSVTYLGEGAFYGCTSLSSRETDVGSSSPRYAGLCGGTE